MKWNNKGNELKPFAEEYEKNIDLEKGVYLFGAGLVGTMCECMFESIVPVNGFLDNHLAGEYRHGLPVISLEDFISNNARELIIISVSEAYSMEIMEQLKKAGLVYKKDFVCYDEFIYHILPILSMYRKEKLFIPLCQTCVTERCTLKCEKCAHACHLVGKDSSDLSLEEVKESANAYFNIVNHTGEFVLIGGEPLLYKELAAAVNYIGSKFRKQIGIFSITTNGTIVPNDAVLDACKKNEVLFRISNYSKSIPKMKEKHERLINKLNEYGVSYSITKEEFTWKDYGFEYVNRKHENLEKVFDECATPCHEVRKNRFYKCVMARCVSENMYGTECGDYLDLNSIDNNSEGKRIMLEYSLGYSDKGYMDICNKCNGKDAEKYVIPAAVQVKKDERR